MLARAGASTEAEAPVGKTEEHVADDVHREADEEGALLGHSGYHLAYEEPLHESRAESHEHA